MLTSPASSTVTKPLPNFRLYNNAAKTLTEVFADLKTQHDWNDVCWDNFGEHDILKLAGMVRKDTAISSRASYDDFNIIFRVLAHSCFARKESFIEDVIRKMINVSDSSRTEGKWKGFYVTFRDEEQLRIFNRLVKDSRNRFVVIYNKDDIPAAIDSARYALSSHSDIYCSDGRISSIIVNITDIGRRRKEIIRYDKDSLVEPLVNAVSFRKFNFKGATFIKDTSPIEPPGIVVKALARGNTQGFRYLKGVSEAPLLRDDGTAAIINGYDPKTGFYINLPDSLVLTVKDRPTKEDAVAAIDDLRHLLREFPFVDSLSENGEVSRSVALAGILTCIARPSLDCAPLIAVNAATPGSGKSAVAEVAFRIATGHEVAHVAYAKSEEFEKRLDAEFLSGATTISIDNVETVLDNMKLKQAISSSTLKSRILGKSVSPVCTMVATIFANGNNLTLPNDMVRRSLLCKIDPKMERPEERVFDVNIKEHVLEYRARYLSDIFTIFRAHSLAGYPCSRVLTGFEKWSKLVRSALLWLGQADPCTSTEALKTADPVTGQLTRVLAAWADAFGFRAVTAEEITTLAESAYQFDVLPQDGKRLSNEEALLKEVSDREKAIAEELMSALKAVLTDDRGFFKPHKLRYYLREMQERFAGGFRFVQCGSNRQHVGLWRLERKPEGNE